MIKAKLIAIRRPCCRARLSNRNAATVPTKEITAVRGSATIEKTGSVIALNQHALDSHNSSVEA